MKIDFVSDVACPWCAVGLNSLEIALSRLEGAVSAQLQFQPFELNPSMPPDGEDAIEYLSRKYGASPEQLAASRQMLRERGASVGFEFGNRVRVWNTFDAHRLLHWAGLQGRQRELKHALLRAYHSRGENPGAPAVLLGCRNRRATSWSLAATRTTFANARPTISSLASDRFLRSSSTTGS